MRTVWTFLAPVLVVVPSLTGCASTAPVARTAPPPVSEPVSVSYARQAPLAPPGEFEMTIAEDAPQVVPEVREKAAQKPTMFSAKKKGQLFSLPSSR
jgi:hypothetical protein